MKISFLCRRVLSIYSDSSAYCTKCNTWFSSQAECQAHLPCKG